MTSTLCPTCSCKIPAHAPEGLCPRCLVSAGLVGSLGTQPLSPSPTDLLSVEELNELLPHREVEALIGRGGMGAVYRARDPRLGRRLAIKVLSGDLAADPAFVERFAREARAVARLEHPNVVQIHQFVDDPDLPYLELEFVPGKSLRELLRAGPLRLDRAREVLLQIAAGLGYAHRNGIVHRDVKPENVLIDEEGRVRLVDFGLAKLTKATTSLTLTGARQVVGTIHYMAPEQLESPEEVSASSDVYSWGVVAYEVLAGRLPLGRFGPPSRYAEVSPELDAIVLRALELEPEERFADGAELQERLVSHFDGVARPAAHDPGPPPRAPETPIAWGLIALALVIVFGVFVVGALILFAFSLRPGPMPAEPLPPRAERSSPKASPNSGPRPETRSTPKATPRSSEPPSESGLRDLEAGASLMRKVDAAKSLRRKTLLCRQEGDFERALELLQEGLEALEGGDRDLERLTGEVRETAAATLTWTRSALLLDVAGVALESPSLPRIERGRASLERVVALDASEDRPSWAVLRIRGELNLLEGRLEEAAADFRALEARSAGPNVAIDSGLGRSDAALHKAARALQRFEKIQKRLPPRQSLEGQELDQRARFMGPIAEAAIQAATELGDEGAVDRWVARSEDAIRGLKGNRARAKVMASRGDVFGAVEELGQVYLEAEGASRQAEVHYLEARILVDYGLTTEARAALARGRALEPQLVASLVEGLAWARDCRADKAQPLLRQVAREAGSWEWRLAAEAWGELARVEFAAGNVPEARESARRSHSLDPSPEARRRLARIELDPYFDGQYLDSAEQIARRLGARGTLLRAWAILQKFVNDPARARRVANGAARASGSPFALDLASRGSRTPSQARALWRAGQSVSYPSGRLYGLGQRFEAESPSDAKAFARTCFAYRAALWHYPFHLGARLGLVRCAETRGNLPAALDQARRVYREHPQEPAAARALGRQLGSAPRSPEVLAAHSEAIGVYGQTPALLAAGVLAATLKGPPEARARDAIMATLVLSSREEEVVRAKVLLLERLAEKSPADTAQELRARAKNLRAEHESAQAKLSKSLKAHVARARGAENSRQALREARAACEMAPRSPAMWSFYTDCALRDRDPRAAVRGSVRAAWLDARRLRPFFVCMQLEIPEGLEGDEAAQPKDLGLKAMLKLAEQVSRGDQSAALNRELEDLGRRYPEQLTITYLLGVHALQAKQARPAQIYFASAATRAPAGPLSFLAGRAYAELPESERSLRTDTLAILSLRDACTAKVKWNEEAIPERLRKSRVWAWLNARTFELSK